jgi:hypothetical protein
LDTEFTIPTSCRVEYASPVPTVKFFVPVPIFREVEEEVK